MSLLMAAGVMVAGPPHPAWADPDAAAGLVTSGHDRYLAPSGNGGIDVRSYRVRLRYDHDSRGIAAARVRLRIAAQHDLSAFSLDARRGLRISTVRVAGRVVRHAHRGSELIISGIPRQREGSVFGVTVDYRGVPRPVRDPSGRDRYGWLRTPGGVVTFSEPAATSSWVPANDVFYDKATWRITLITPPGLLGVSSGNLVSLRRTGAAAITSWRMATPIQPYAQALAVDRFRYSTADIAGIPAFVAVARGVGTSVSTMQRRTAKAIRWLEARLGPYPFSSTGAIVVSGRESAMETAGRPTYSPDTYYVSMGTVLHEQAHQWFGNRLTAEQSADIWLHEGFATYLENVEHAERSGLPLGDVVHGQYVVDGWSRGYHGQFDRAALADPGARYLLNTTPYFRGQAAVHALRHTVGDQQFWRILRGLVRVSAGTTTHTGAVIDVAERISGADLSGWADAWVYSTGYQRLPEDPSHRQVLREIGPGIMNAASDHVWKPRGTAAAAMARALRRYSPMNQVTINSVTQARGSGRSRYFVDFQTRPGVLYPKAYRSCFTFRAGDDELLAGAYLGVRVSSRPAINRFTLAPCPAAV
jgi:aminopeptidase N